MWWLLNKFKYTLELNTQTKASLKQKGKQMKRIESGIKFSSKTSVATILEIAEELDCDPETIFKFCLLKDDTKKEVLKMIRDVIQDGIRGHPSQGTRHHSNH